MSNFDGFVVVSIRNIGFLKNIYCFINVGLFFFDDEKEMILKVINILK